VTRRRSAQRSASSHLLERFRSLGHQSVANEASGQLKYGKAGLALSQADLSMLRGDFFEEQDLAGVLAPPRHLGTL
jgi:hypothetical protein